MISFVLSGCGGGGGSATASAPTSGPHQPQSACAATPQSAADGPAPRLPAMVNAVAPLHAAIIATVSGARELAFLPNGDLLVGTSGSSVSIVPNADGLANAGKPRTFATFPDAPAAGVAFLPQTCTIFVGTQLGIYKIPYKTGDVAAEQLIKIASVRPGGSSGHATTSVAVTATTVYASVGSSCNACNETDPTRATIQQMNLEGSGMSPKAIRIRNAIGLTVNPNTGSLWTGDAGQDALPLGHPYEFLDPVTTHPAVADYGWPVCEENRQRYGSGADCSNQVVPAVEFPAYESIIGVAIAPVSAGGAYPLPSQYAGGAFVAMHGSWHNERGVPVAPPRVSFVTLSGDTPTIPVNWSNPSSQWSDVLTGFQNSDGSRNGRPTGIAIGPQGDLFVADDYTGVIYRIRI